MPAIDNIRAKKRDDSALEDCIVARCPNCRMIVFVCVSPAIDNDTIKELVDCVKAGYNVEHMTVGGFSNHQTIWKNASVAIATKINPLCSP